MLILSCDPGLGGGLALLRDGELLECTDIPTSRSGLETGKLRRWVSPLEVAYILRTWDVRHTFGKHSLVGVIERPIPMPQMPSTTNASTFDTFGVVRAIFESRCDRVDYVAPAKWKGFYGFGTDKAGARAACLALYPDAPVQRVKDHNRAEAILIGHWLYKTEFA